ncbi:MAG TPA: hypothetical protein VMM12_13920 [Longimicrobiales bacterium]|nr:hypothetical protein [Longimicrobiales bacterium]
MMKRTTLVMGMLAALTMFGPATPSGTVVSFASVPGQTVCPAESSECHAPVDSPMDPARVDGRTAPPAGWMLARPGPGCGCTNPSETPA